MISEYRVQSADLRSVFEVRNDEVGNFLCETLRFLAALCVIAVTQRNAEEFLISCFVGKDTNKE
jgi:hypothetical protein